ncbi:MAG: phospho-sugar mutase [Candidatus Nanopelagicales bacterium]
MTTLPDETRARAEAWLAEDPDPQTRQRLTELLAAADGGDAAAASEVADAFDGRLQFGTAGLRGALGPGPNRMNRVVVIRAAAGLADYLRERGGGAAVVGYDARTNSDVFARDTAAVMRGAGLSAMVLPRPLPTPVLAYAIRALGCAAGVMVTASHNPPQDNGYKVYLGDGSQIVPPADAEISACIDAVGPLADVPLGGEWDTLSDSIADDYLARAVSLVLDDSPRHVRVVYTPMHGVGGDIVVSALERAGFPEPVVVAPQFDPDPAFPTVSFPNPEEPGAMDLALAEAELHEADVVVANDPDADRCALAVPTREGGWRMLRGDEVGALLGWWILERGVRSGRPVTGAYACSIVSSSLLGRIAADAGLPYAETLTGFKWISRVPGLAFGYEEALGYCVDPDGVKDKDGVSAALLLVELVATLKASGRTVHDVLDDLARRFGLHATDQLSVRVTDLSLIADAMARLRAQPPTSLGGRAVERLDDLERGTADLPPTDGLRFVLADQGRVIIRPSGTEPKVKCYLEVVEPVDAAAETGDGHADVDAARERAAASLAAISADVAAALGI